MAKQNKVKRSELLERIEALEQQTAALMVFRRMLQHLVTYESTVEDPLALHPRFNHEYMELLGKWLEKTE